MLLCRRLRSLPSEVLPVFIQRSKVQCHGYFVAGGPQVVAPFGFRWDTKSKEGYEIDYRNFENVTGKVGCLGQ